jgi:hypothetical protein
MQPTIQPLAAPSAGDLIFVKPGPGDWVGGLVARGTHGPYCHVRVAISEYEVIEALPRGVARVAYDAAEIDPADVAHTGATLAPLRQAHALATLARQVGQGYGWLDDLYDALGVLTPRALRSRTPFLIAPSRFNCSDLATLFLIEAGYQWLPDAMTLNPRAVSPNDLARALSLIK